MEHRTLVRSRRSTLASLSLASRSLPTLTAALVAAALVCAPISGAAEIRVVAGGTRFFRCRNVMAGNTGDRIDQVTHRTARAGTEIEDKRIILR